MKTRVAILGATGVIGSQYVSLLHNHPWFEIAALTASKPGVHELGYPITTLEELSSCPLVFSTLPSGLAKIYEPRLAAQGTYVISSAAAHRKEHPVIIPEINLHHIGTSHLITKPNCTTQGFLLPLAPLHRAATIKALSVTTLQATSGAGKSAEPLSDNVLPYIEGEEEKLMSEPHKILEAHFPISAHCNRVPVNHGHLACVSVSFEKALSADEIRTLWSAPSQLSLPSAPRYPIHYTDEEMRPQPLLDRDREGGMCVTVGRLRPCALFEWRFVTLSHNAVRGGAGGGVLIAEHLKQEGLLG